MAAVTPFRRYKLWPHAGGIRTPLIVACPAGIADGGAIRHQRVDAIDIGPTILDIAGTAFHPTVAGVSQIPVAGRSIRLSFSQPGAPGRQVQFFELRGNRAITDGRWKAVAIHRFGTSFADDRWQLFDTEADFDGTFKYRELVENNPPGNPWGPRDSTGAAGLPRASLYEIARDNEALDVTGRHPDAQARLKQQLATFRAAAVADPRGWLAGTTR